MAEQVAAPVRLDDLGDGVVQITMEEREGRNTFTPAFIQGITDAFARAGENEGYKVAVLTGYDSYFASGGTREELLRLHRGEAQFDELSFYRLALDCPIPVISAMQGHGIGGGLVFGLYADSVILAHESLYSTNFMKYGFTPGLGATLIVPDRFGALLAHEMLYTARNYRGEELAERGVPFPVLPRREVLAHARQLAAQLAEKPRGALVSLKAHLTAGLKERLPTIVAQELRMHEQTFHQPDVARRIEEHFGR